MCTTIPTAGKIQSTLSVQQQRSFCKSSSLLSCLVLEINLFGKTRHISILENSPPKLPSASWHVFYTCFALLKGCGGLDAIPKLNIVACDIEPSILARNVLISQLILDGKKQVCCGSCHAMRAVCRLFRIVPAAQISSLA